MERDDLQARIDAVLQSIKLDDVTGESNEIREDLPDGYYLAQVEKTELLESKSKGEPMIAFTFSVVNPGISVDVDTENSGAKVFHEIPHSVGRKLWLYYVLKDNRTGVRFVSDMLKFESEPGEPILPKEAFLRTDTMLDAIDCLVGMRIYINRTLGKAQANDDRPNYWNNLISWDRATKLGLPGTDGDSDDGIPF